MFVMTLAFGLEIKINIYIYIYSLCEPALGGGEGGWSLGASRRLMVLSFVVTPTCTHCHS